MFSCSNSPEPLTATTLMQTDKTLHESFQQKPFWWEAFEPVADNLDDVPAHTSVAIIGGGYAGLAAARELDNHGVEATVFDAGAPGNAASTRSGGVISGGGSAKKPLLAQAPHPAQAHAMMTEFNAALEFLEQLIDEENIDCGWSKTGRFTDAWSPRHLAGMRVQAKKLNAVADIGARVVTANEQREHIGSDFYHGGIVVDAAGHLHPSLCFKGLFEACTRRGVRICAQAGVTKLEQVDGKWIVHSARGTTRADAVLVATNGYTGGVTPALKRRLLPLRAYIIATEPLTPDLAESLSPRNHALSDSKRITSFYRLWKPEGRMIFGSRMRWGDIEPKEMAPLLHRAMVERFPDLASTKVTHAWTGNVALTVDERPHIGALDGLHYVLGCNGSGVANMT
jgi:glycine/D-amino acid oxidase-like deaminating enzyme